MAIQPVGPYIPPASTSATSAVTRPSSAASVDEASKGDKAVVDPVEAPVSQPPSRAQINDAMVEVKKALAPVARNLQFSIDDETGRSVVKVVDATTNEVIRQFPSEELLAITRSIDKLSGLFVKHKA